MQSSPLAPGDRRQKSPRKRSRSRLPGANDGAVRIKKSGQLFGSPRHRPVSLRHGGGTANEASPAIPAAQHLLPLSFLVLKGSAQGASESRWFHRASGSPTGSAQAVAASPKAHAHARVSFPDGPPACGSTRRACRLRSCRHARASVAPLQCPPLHRQMIRKAV
jgi:hypothetical protein